MSNCNKISKIIVQHEQTMKKQLPHSRIKAAAQAGFTLIELLVVIVILGILVAIYAPKIFSSTDPAKATSIYTAADRLAINWRMITESCGVSKVVGTSPITTTANAANHLQLLVDGNNVAAAYTACYARSGVELARAQIKGTAPNYNIDGYPLSISGVTDSAGNARVATLIQGVPDEKVLLLVNKYSSQANANTKVSFTAGESDSTDPVIRYTAGTGSRDVTIIR
ncbi:type II secretion system protein [Chromobacterium vaccinii]|uniref:type II secretion system protein n=1 Tax=Chromobacterium vaccinii TaxID=1108595 RepID=UPI003C761614